MNTQPNFQMCMGIVMTLHQCDALPCSGTIPAFRYSPTVERRTTNQ